MNCKNYSLKELCEMYIRMITTGINGIMRMQIHGCIAERIGSSYEDLRMILHNLDKEIGFDITDLYTREEIRTYANNLHERLKHRMRKANEERKI